MKRNWLLLIPLIVVAECGFSPDSDVDTGAEDTGAHWRQTE